jgi:hypothetical protein
MFITKHHVVTKTKEMGSLAALATHIHTHTRAHAHVSAHPVPCTSNVMHFLSAWFYLCAAWSTNYCHMSLMSVVST